jgi:FtsZ-binding cell division protein ZapB
MSVLDHLVKIAPLFPQLVLDDCHFTISDTEKFIVSIPGDTLVMAIKVGDPIKEGAITKVALEKKERLIVEGNKELYGVAHIAVCTPIIENGEAVGCVSIGYSMEKSDKINQMADKLSDMVNEISETSKSIATSSQELARRNENLTAISDSVKDKMEVISDVVEFVLHITSRTNLLGLNAEIESAHAGEYGRGFAVVAKEIRRLSQESQQSSNKIKTEIETIESLIYDILKEIEHSAGFTEEQAASTEELSAAMEQLNVSAKELSDLSVIDR